MLVEPPVVKLQVLFAAKATSLRSFTPVVMVTVYTALAFKLTAGVKVAVLPA